MNWTKHKAKWIDCTRCLLCEGRSKVVLARGSIPAPILLIGEAPGESEDVLGKPFCGPAGKLLDSILDQSIDGQFDYCITNLVGCIPREDGGGKAVEPPPEAIQICRERLLELIAMAKPQLIITVGALATKEYPKIKAMSALNWTINFVGITHPAAILRMNIAAQPLEIKRAVATISDAIEDLG